MVISKKGLKLNFCTKAFSTHSRQKFVNKTSHTHQIFSNRWRPSRGGMESIFWHMIELWVSFPMPPVWVQSTSCSRSYARFIEWWTEHTVQLGGWPSWINHTTIRQAGSTTRSAWLFDGMDRSNPSDGRAGLTNPSSSRPRSSSPRDLIKLTLVSFRSETPLELYDFKTARTHFLVWSSNLSYETATVN